MCDTVDSLTQLVFICLSLYSMWIFWNFLIQKLIKIRSFLKFSHCLFKQTHFGCVKWGTLNSLSLWSLFLQGREAACWVSWWKPAFILNRGENNNKNSCPSLWGSNCGQTMIAEFPGTRKRVTGVALSVWRLLCHCVIGKCVFGRITVLCTQ